MKASTATGARRRQASGSVTSAKATASSPRQGRKLFPVQTSYCAPAHRARATIQSPQRSHQARRLMEPPYSAPGAERIIP